MSCGGTDSDDSDSLVNFVAGRRFVLRSIKDNDPDLDKALSQVPDANRKGRWLHAYGVHTSGL